MSMMIERLILRPPDVLMWRQFLNELVIKDCMGIEEIVWFQFSTFKVVSEISTTVPSVEWLGISIQSPTLTRSLVDNCTPATSPRIGSLKTRSNTAVNAPIPERNTAGDLSNIAARIKIKPIE